jgi:hypothetical protein
MKLVGIVKILSRPENSYNHVEEMRSGFDQNENYCSKEGKLIELGTRPAQGTRTDRDSRRARRTLRRSYEILAKHE